MSGIQMTKWSYGFVLAALLVGGLAACKGDRSGAGDSSSQGAVPTQAAPTVEAARPASLTTQAVTAVGMNYCLGCALKKEQGAAAQCSVYGHRHAFKVESAAGADGQALPQLAGETLHYLDNDQSAQLLRGDDFHNERVEVKGKLFAPEHTIDVSEVKAL